MTDRDIIFLVGVITVGGTLVVFVWQALAYFRGNRRDDDEQGPQDSAER